MTKTRNRTAVESTAFVPKHFPRTRLASGRMLSDAQQYQYDVLRTVDGKLVKDRNGWWRELSDTVLAPNEESLRKRVFGLNITAMFKLVELGLIECALDAGTWGYMFLLPERAKDVPGPRYTRVKQIAKETL